MLSWIADHPWLWGGGIVALVVLGLILDGRQCLRMLRSDGPAVLSDEIERQEGARR